MLFLISLALAVILLLILAPLLRKRPLPFYITGAVVSAAVTVLSQQHIENTFLRNYVLAIFSKGAFAGALWVIVMFIGALPNGSRLMKRLMPARGELSIFAALITISHIVTYAVSYIKRLLAPEFSPKADFIVTCFVCIALLLIMLPLTVTSFKRIRRRMNAKNGSSSSGERISSMR